jgi:hypothetical protein
MTTSSLLALIYLLPIIIFLIIALCRTSIFNNFKKSVEGRTNERNTHIVIYYDNNTGYDKSNLNKIQNDNYYYRHV